ncbi:MAG: GntR family transcriptional regulator [Christensenellaceae bacterium]|jgi:GntR family transcriptional regulator|nr:GntR family transcriptional regulator [Christensenellaceae bacterium]
MGEQKMEWASVRSRLLYEMKEGIFKDKKRLPSEAELATSMGVSRTLVRDNLALLEQEGFITRRQGIGTMINKHVLDVTTRVDLEMEFSEMIAEAGAAPAVKILEINTIFCDERIAEKLGIRENTPVFLVSRLITANGKPAIHCVDYLSFQLIKDYTYQREDLEKPLFYFLKKFCDTDVYMDLTIVRPVLTDERLAKIFNADVGVPLLRMDEVGYNIDGQRVLYAEEYYIDGVLEHTMLRKKI